MRLVTYAILLVGLLACLGVLYFHHETEAAEHALTVSEPGRL